MPPTSSHTLDTAMTPATVSITILLDTGQASALARDSRRLGINLAATHHALRDLRMGR